MAFNCDVCLIGTGFILLSLAGQVFFISVKLLVIIRVKSGNFGHQVNSDNDLVVIILIIGMKNKLNK